MRKGVHGPLAQSGNTPPPELLYRPPPDNGLNILYADDDILVLSKPSGLLSVPGNKPNLQDCMETRARAQYPSATTVHRLDRPTSGVFLMALNRESHRRLGIQFEKRKTAKTYKAFVSGVVNEDRGRIDQAIRTDWYNRPKQMIDNCMGREAITDWRVLKRLENKLCQPNANVATQTDCCRLSAEKIFFCTFGTSSRMSRRLAFLAGN